LTIYDKLGQGGFGEVYRVKLQNQFYALKREKVSKSNKFKNIVNEAKVRQTK
jgi:serine/threonine protein kinase